MTITRFKPAGHNDLINYRDVQQACDAGLVTADHFANVVGLGQYILIDDREGEEMIHLSRLRRILRDDLLEVLVIDTDHPNGYAVRMTADEYALRIEAT